MTCYNVHLFREMRLRFDGIEAESPEEAAAIARERLTSEADDIDDCEGENHAALVDRAGDDEFAESVMIDFAEERLRQATPDLLAFCSQVVAARQAGEVVPDPLYAAAVLLTALVEKTVAEAIEAGPLLPAARFEIEHDPLENPDRAYVLVDGLFDVAIIRTVEGIVIDVYPKDWLQPIGTLTVWDDQVAATHCDEAGEA